MFICPSSYDKPTVFRALQLHWHSNDVCMCVCVVRGWTILISIRPQYVCSDSSLIEMHPNYVHDVNMSCKARVAIGM
jgi:hypothetical protein